MPMAFKRICPRKSHHSCGLVTLACFGLNKGYCQTRLIQAIPTKSFGFLPLLVAQQRGFYQAEGLEVLAPVMKTVAQRRSAHFRRSALCRRRFCDARRVHRYAREGRCLSTTIVRPWSFVGRPEIRSVRDLQGKEHRHPELRQRRGLRYPADPASSRVGQIKDYTLVPMGPEPQRIHRTGEGARAGDFVQSRRRGHR